MPMSRKDFVAIADVIAEQRLRHFPGDPQAVETIDRISAGIAEHCASVSSTFDRAAFMATARWRPPTPSARGKCA